MLIIGLDEILAIFISASKEVMSYSVGTLWIIYIIVVVVSFIISGFLLGSAQRYYRSISYGTVFFVAAILGAFAVFIGAAWLDPNQLSTTDKTWLSVLFVVAFILPIFVILYVVWEGEYVSLTGEDDCLPACCKKDDSCDNESYVKQTIHCDIDTGVCQVTKKMIYQGNNVTKVIYSSKHGNIS